MLSGKQRSYLRRMANPMQALFQVGKLGITDNVIKQFDDALEAKELLKTTVQSNAPEDAREICDIIAEKTRSEVVQVIGNRFVLYRESVNKKTITLPK